MPVTSPPSAMDVGVITADYWKAEAALSRAVRVEARRAIRAWKRGRRMKLEVTPKMVDALNALYHAGVRHARREAKALGVKIPATYATMVTVPLRLHKILRRLIANLSGMALRLERDAKLGTDDGLVRGSLNVGAVVQAVGVAGALDGLLPQTFTSGLADTYEGAADAFDGWQYSAELDGGTCNACEPLDGETYATLDEAYAVLPDFGPNPDCEGGWRCRCRLVPIGPA